MLDFAPDLNFVIAIGKERVSTPLAYARLDEINNSYVDYRPTDESLTYQRMIYDLITGNGVAVPNYNVFEQVIKSDEIDKIKEMMIKSGADTTLMSGSGPSVFCYCGDSLMAESVRQSLEKGGFTAFACSSVYPEEFI